MDAVACVTVPEDVQRKRVLERGTMTQAQLEAILAKQIPNSEKCARSDYVIETNTLEGTRRQVHDVVTQINSRLTDA